MGLFSSSMKLDSFETLFCAQLEDLYDAEQRLTKVLPNMIEAAEDAELREDFQQHLRETQAQVSRLQKVFAIIGHQPNARTCEAMKGLSKEGEEIINATGPAAVKDAALIAAAQRVSTTRLPATAPCGPSRSSSAITKPPACCKRRSTRNA